MWWGYTEALDIQREFIERKNTENNSHNEVPTSGELNVLLYGSSDGRHILKTLSKMYEHPRKKVNFFIIEPTLELYARQMMLLSIALEPADKLGLHEKTRLFMETYGNTLVRPTTASFIAHKAAQLTDFVTDLDQHNPVFKLDQLKYKERDGLETILTFWHKPHSMNLTRLWDVRLRKSLGIRYDARAGVFDWDYHMNLLAKTGYDKVNKAEYKNWRATGVAFTWLETQYSKGNPTLLSGIMRLQDTAMHYGYCGDLVTGPYAGFGLDCEDKEMLKKAQDMYMKRATDIMERNVIRLMHEIQNGAKYVHKISEGDNNAGVVITEITEHVEEAEIYKKEERAKRRERLEMMDVNCSVTLLPLKYFKEPQTLLAKYESFFDVVWIGHYLVKHLTEEFVGLAKIDALMLIENKKYLVEFKEKELEDFGQVLEELTKNLKVEKFMDFDPLKDSVAKFLIRKDIPTVVK